MRDTTRPVTLQVDFDGADVSPIGDERVGFSAATDINRDTINAYLKENGITGVAMISIDGDWSALRAKRIE